MNINYKMNKVITNRNTYWLESQTTDLSAGGFSTPSQHPVLRMFINWTSASRNKNGTSWHQKVEERNEAIIQELLFNYFGVILHMKNYYYYIHQNIKGYSFNIPRGARSTWKYPRLYLCPDQVEDTLPWIVGYDRPVPLTAYRPGLPYRPRLWLRNSSFSVEW